MVVEYQWKNFHITDFYSQKGFHIGHELELDKFLQVVFLEVVFHSTNILKLLYAFHHDLKELSKSYGELHCFHDCEAPILDLQEAFPSIKGVLSRLSKTMLGSTLNKTIQLSGWEKSPLRNS